MKNTAIIGIGNQKGGVGKTTVTVQLACALADMGRKILIIDLDVNAGSTKHFGIKPEAFLGTFEVLADKEDPFNVIITRDDDFRKDEGINNLPENVHIISGSRKLEKLEERIRESKSKFDRSPLYDCIKEPLAALRGSYDYIFLDTPPSAPLPIVAAYDAADGFLLVAMPEGLAIQGLREALHDIEEVRKFGNPSLKLIGITLTGVENRTRLSRELVAYVADAFSDHHLRPVIPRATIIPTAQTQEKTVFQVDPNHVVSLAFRELAKNFENNIEKFLGIKHEGIADVTLTESEEAING